MSLSNTIRKGYISFITKQYKFRYLSSTVAGKSLVSDTKQVSAVPDILMNNFKHATSTRDILSAVSQHRKVMNAKHIMQALRSLFVLQKEGRSELSTKEIVKNKDFAKLCGRLKSLAGVIDINESIEALKVVTYVGVPKDSTIAQVLLQLIRHNINDLSLSHIIFLEFLLGHYSNVPLAEALKLALPILFEIHLPVKMDKSLSSLREYLFFATRNRLSSNTIDLILLNMLKCEETEDVKIAKSIVWSLTDLCPSPNSERLLAKNLETLVTHADELTYDDMDVTLSKLTNAYRKEHEFFRNELFCNVVVDCIIDKDLGIKHASFTMKKLDKLGVINRYLVDYVSSKIEEDTSDSETNIHNIYLLLKYLSKTDYRPSNWKNIERIAEEVDIEKMKYSNWLKLCASFCYHRIFHEGIIMKCLNQDLEDIFKKRTSHVYLFLAIYHSIKLYKTELLRLFPRHLRIKDLIKYLLIPEQFPLEGALYNAFGGEKYVKSGLYSKEAIFIDHAIVFRKGGYPVATNCKSTFVEDLETTPDNQVILIMRMLPDVYTEQNKLKRGPMISLQVLEDLGYVVVPICWNTWDSLADYEKIPYLVQSIKEKLGEDMMLADGMT